MAVGESVTCTKSPSVSCPFPGTIPCPEHCSYNSTAGSTFAYSFGIDSRTALSAYTDDELLREVRRRIRKQ